MTRPRNQIVKHFLIKWAYYDTNYEQLNSIEKVRMKVLYSSLKELDEDERQFLAEKYRVDSYQLKFRAAYLNDAELAKDNGLKLIEYRIKRIAIEDKLKLHIVKNRGMFDKELQAAIQEENMKQWVKVW